ncbi:hypothetical protein D3C73_715680 [compost metagenome]
MVQNNEITSQDKYLSTLEITSLSGARTIEQLTIFKEIGQTPNIGDFIEAIKTELGEQVEIEELHPYWKFKTVLGYPTNIKNFKVLRTMLDNTFQKITLI